MKKPGHDNDIVLAGLPRSGSTLTCHLINKLPGAVALNEPMNLGRFKERPDNGAICDDISEFFVTMRGSLHESGTTISKHIDGVVPGNPVAVPSSWNTVSIPIRDGRAPKGERMDPELHAAQESIPGRLDRQVYLLSWFFKRFSALPVERIIRYEDFIASAGSCLRTLATRIRCIQEQRVQLSSRTNRRGIKREPRLELDPCWRD